MVPNESIVTTVFLMDKVTQLNCKITVSQNYNLDVIFCKIILLLLKSVIDLKVF